MEVCKHHKPFKQLTTHHSFLKKKKQKKKEKKKSSFSSKLCGITGVVWNP